MSDNKEHNSAFIRTDKAIIEAMIELLKEKSFESITVQDIMEKTPVTRSTFYAHYYDKYEVVEKMQELYIKAVNEMQNTLSVDTRFHAEVIRKQSVLYGDLIQSLLKVHTEKVDIRDYTSRLYYEKYMNNHPKSNENPYPQQSAEIYAQLMCAFHFVGMENMNEITRDNAYFNHVVIPAVLAAFRFEDNETIKNAFKQSTR